MILKKYCEDVWSEFTSNTSTLNRSIISSNHSEIEKRRRDRMNDLLQQLADLLPTSCGQKLDKLSVLRLTLDYISTMSMLNDEKINCDSCMNYIKTSDLLILLKQNAENFITVVDASSGKILYASDEICKFLNDNIVKRNWFEIIHPADAVVFKNETIMDYYKSDDLNDSACDAVSSSTGCYTQESDCSFGLKRSFQCRLRNYKSLDRSESNYENFHCYGMLRDTNKPIVLMLLIRLLPSGMEKFFQIIITPKGRIVRCGYGLYSTVKRLPQDLIGCCYYDLIHEGDLIDVAYHHKQVLKLSETRELNYRIRITNTQCINVTATWTPFKNPWNLRNQFIIINHHNNSMRDEQEISPEQSILKQLLLMKQTQKSPRGSISDSAVLGVAHLAESANEDN